jgi:peptidoglycan/xylan/chitin deacetylase (PgdA/CDA1 family)
MTDFHICFTMDCESVRPEVNDLDLGRRAMRGYADLNAREGWHATFFVVPEQIEPMADLLSDLQSARHEIGLHFHPETAGYSSPYLGTFSADEQAEIIGTGVEIYRRVLGREPVSMRPGYFSANDATFPVSYRCGIRQTSASCPGRKMTGVAANWAGAPLFAHYAHPHNRFLEGGLDLVEIPPSTDWETMIWGGIHPQDLRIEYTDAKNHGFLARKVMKRQCDENLPLKALVPVTHDIFDYSDPANFRRETMQGVIAEIKRYGNDLGIELIGSTLAEAAAAYRQAMVHTT